MLDMLIHVTPVYSHLCPALKPRLAFAFPDGLYLKIIYSAYYMIIDVSNMDPGIGGISKSPFCLTNHKVSDVPKRKFQA